MLSLLLLAGTALVDATPGPAWHYPRQVANNASITSSLPSSAALTGTAAHNCSWTWDRWLSRSLDAEFLHSNTTETYTYYNITASLTTECDGITRIVGDLTTVATGTNTTFTSTTRNYTEAPPTCTPEPADCKDINIGFGTYPCPRPTTGVVKTCGQCSIWGGTVDLIYFPITSTTSHNLCPDPTVSPGSATICPLGPTTATRNATNPYDYQPCYYATGNQTSTANSGPYVVSGGHTFYQNRAYISLQTAYASDECGVVGQKHEGTILELKSQDVYSVGGYHHEFQDAGYQFNFQDLQAVPSYAYYMDCNAGGPASCYYEGTRYRYGTDFLNGHTDIDLGESGVGSTDKQWIFQEAYTPILLLPTQIRDLDPAWATCSLNLGGLYDPPKALTQAATAPGPTAPTPEDPSGGTTTAQPGDGPTTPGPTPTSVPDDGPTTTAGDRQPTGTPDDPEDGDGDDDGSPTPTTPSEPDQPGTTGGEGGDGASPTTPNDPAPTTPDEPSPTDGGNGGGSNGGDGSDDDGGDESDDDGGDAGGNDGQDGGGEDGQDGNGDGDGQNNGGSGGDSGGDGNDNGDSGGDGDDNSDQNGGDDAGDSNDGSPSQPTTILDLGGVFESAAAQPTPTTTAPNVGDVIASVIGETDTPAPTGNAGGDDDDAPAPVPAPVTFTASDDAAQTLPPVVEGSTLPGGGSAGTVNGAATISAAPSGVVDVGSAGSGDGAVEISTLATGSRGVYVADGTTLSAGGAEEVVGGVTLSAAGTGVVTVDASQSGTSATGSTGAEAPQQTGNGGVSLGFGASSWFASGAAVWGFAAAVAVL